MTKYHIPKGYKQTELGIIPEDWEYLIIAHDATLKARIGWQALTTKEYLLSGDFFLVTGTDFTSGMINWNTSFYVSEWRYKQDRNIQLKENDVLITKDGTIGKVGYVYTLPKPAVLNSGVFVIRPRNNSFVPLFLFYILKSRIFDDFLEQITAGSTIIHLYQKDFINFGFYAPPKPEQEAIAKVLSDVDGLIDRLKVLIEKKQAIKTATMQQLLTGKTRLPEFQNHSDGTPKGYKQSELGTIPEDWEYLIIAHDATLKARIGWQALTTKEYLLSGDFFLVTGTDFTSGMINWNTSFYVSEWRYKQDRNIQLKENDVLITKDGTIGKVGYVYTLPKPAVLNSGVFVIRPRNNSFVPLFLFYILKSRIFDDFLEQITAGSTIIHLYQKDFINFGFYAPPKLEQTAIAKILSDMDNEINTLKEQLTKTEALKQGMMQELLTGKTRLLTLQS